jgi:hypothetical protein
VTLTKSFSFPGSTSGVYFSSISPPARPSFIRRHGNGHGDGYDGVTHSGGVPGKSNHSNHISIPDIAISTSASASSGLNRRRRPAPQDRVVVAVAVEKPHTHTQPHTQTQIISAEEDGSDERSASKHRAEDLIEQIRQLRVRGDGHSHDVAPPAPTPAPQGNPQYDDSHRHHNTHRNNHEQITSTNRKEEKVFHRDNEKEKVLDESSSSQYQHSLFVSEGGGGDIRSAHKEDSSRSRLQQPGWNNRHGHDLARTSSSTARMNRNTDKAASAQAQALEEPNSIRNYLDAVQKSMPQSRNNTNTQTQNNVHEDEPLRSPFVARTRTRTSSSISRRQQEGSGGSRLHSHPHQHLGQGTTSIHMNTTTTTDRDVQTPFRRIMSEISEDTTTRTSQHRHPQHGSGGFNHPIVVVNGNGDDHGMMDADDPPPIAEQNPSYGSSSGAGSINHHNHHNNNAAEDILEQSIQRLRTSADAAVTKLIHTREDVDALLLENEQLAHMLEAQKQQMMVPDPAAAAARRRKYVPLTSTMANSSSPSPGQEFVSAFSTTFDLGQDQYGYLAAVMDRHFNNNHNHNNNVNVTNATSLEVRR